MTFVCIMKCRNILTYRKDGIMEDIFKKLEELYGQEVDPTPYGNGHINRTYVTKGSPRLLIQQINTNVFPNPRGMMDNIIAVTEHVKPKLAAKGKDPDRATLTVIPNKNGETLTQIGDLYFRVYYFIEDSCCYDLVSPPILEAAGKSFGEFQQMLVDFPAETLFEVIPHFHDTPHRFEAFRAAIEADVKGRAAECADEINYYASHEAFYHTVADRLADGRLPLAVTHNDTKINNVLFDYDGNGLCVIDLDTVMPGSRLYDYGDALRTGAATAAEDEEDLSKVGFDEEKFAAFTRGYLSTVKDAMTAEEIALLPESFLLLTLECGMRFLTDFLAGDTYFRIHKPNHNLIRARNQMKQAIEIEKALPRLHEIVKTCVEG